MRRTNFWTGLAGVIVGALLVAAIPAIAQDAETHASPGDPFQLGVTNIVDANTSLRGDTGGANLVLRNTGNGVPLSLRNNTGGVPNGKAPMEVDSRRLVKNLNVDRVDFRHANELNRAAFGSTPNAADANGAAATATITAPRPGILVMGGSVDANGNTEDLYTCRLQIDGVTVPGSIRGSKVDDGGGDHTDNDAENCSTDGAQNVDAGTRTVTLLMADRSTAAFLEASVWVIWVPFDGDGEVPAP